MEDLVVTFKCKKNECTEKLAELIHDKLRGIPSYVDCGILLSIDGDTITFALGSECNDQDKIAAIGWQAFKAVCK